MSTVHDPSIGMRYVANNEGLYRKVLAKFAVQQAAAAGEIEKALAENDMETAQRLAHTLKGLSASMGLPQLTETATSVDRAFKSGDDISALLPVLKSQLEEALATIGVYLGS